jgi:hypothetical protein
MLPHPLTLVGPSRLDIREILEDLFNPWHTVTLIQTIIEHPVGTYTVTFTGATGITASLYRILYNDEARIILNEHEFYTVTIVDRPLSSSFMWTMSHPYTGSAPKYSFESEKSWHFPCILYKKGSMRGKYQVEYTEL